MVKLSVSMMAWDSQYNTEMFNFMSEHVYEGLELIPTKVQSIEPYSHLPKFKHYIENLRDNYHISIPSMQSLTYGRDENIFDGRVLINYLKEAITFAGELGINNLVFGSPKNRILPQDFPHKQVISIFKELGDFAKEHQTTFSIEANPEIYGGNFILTTYDAIKLIKEVNSPNFKLNLDLGTVIENQENLQEILSENLNLINHIHLSEPYLNSVIIHEDYYLTMRNYLKNYRGFVSIEMKNLNNIMKVKEVMLNVREYFVDDIN